jgi:hypothetical protein
MIEILLSFKMISASQYRGYIRIGSVDCELNFASTDDCWRCIGLVYTNGVGMCA